MKQLANKPITRLDYIWQLVFLPAKTESWYAVLKCIKLAAFNTKKTPESLSKG